MLGTGAGPGAASPYQRLITLVLSRRARLSLAADGSRPVEDWKNGPSLACAGKEQWTIQKEATRAEKFSSHPRRRLLVRQHPPWRHRHRKLHKFTWQGELTSLRLCWPGPDVRPVFNGEHARQNPLVSGSLLRGHRLLAAPISYSPGPLYSFGVRLGIALPPVMGWRMMSTTTRTMVPFIQRSMTHRVAVKGSRSVRP